MERELIITGDSAILRSCDADKAGSESLVLQIWEVVVAIVEVAEAISLNLEINRSENCVESHVDDGVERGLNPASCS